jgi:hypothetical protein
MIGTCRLLTNTTIGSQSRRRGRTSFSKGRKSLKKVIVRASDGGPPGTAFIAACGHFTIE